MPEDILRPILDPLPVDPAVKSDVWDHFYQSDSPQDFKQRFDKLAIPDEAKASLWDLKFGQRQPNAPAEPPTPTSALPPPRQTSLPTSTEGQNNRFQIQGPPQFSGPLADPSDPTSRLPTHEEAQQQAAEYARSTVDKIVRVGSPRILGAEPPAPDLRRAGAAVVNPQLTQPAANKLPLEQPSYGDAVEAALAGDFKKAHELGARPPAAVSGIVKDLDSFLVGPFQLHSGLIQAAGSMASPEGAALLGATGGIGAAAESGPALLQATAKSVQAGISAYFGLKGTEAIAKEAPELYKAVKAGDVEGIAKGLGFVSADAAMAYFATKHAEAASEAAAGNVRQAAYETQSRFGKAKEVKAEVVPNFREMSDDELRRAYDQATAKGQKTTREDIAVEIHQRAALGNKKLAPGTAEPAAETAPEVQPIAAESAAEPAQAVEPEPVAVSTRPGAGAVAERTLNPDAVELGGPEPGVKSNRPRGPRDDYHVWRDAHFTQDRQGLWEAESGQYSGAAYTDERLHELFDQSTVDLKAEPEPKPVRAAAAERLPAGKTDEQYLEEAFPGRKQRREAAEAEGRPPLKIAKGSPYAGDNPEDLYTGALRELGGHENALRAADDAMRQIRDPGQYGEPLSEAEGKKAEKLKADLATAEQAYNDKLSEIADTFGQDVADHAAKVAEVDNTAEAAGLPRELLKPGDAERGFWFEYMEKAAERLKPIAEKLTEPELRAKIAQFDKRGIRGGVTHVLRDELNSRFAEAPNEHGVYEKQEDTAEVLESPRSKSDRSFLKVFVKKTPAGWISSQSGEVAGLGGWSGPLTTVNAYPTREAAIRAELKGLTDKIAQHAKTGADGKLDKGSKRITDWVKLQLAALDEKAAKPAPPVPPENAAARPIKLSNYQIKAQLDGMRRGLAGAKGADLAKRKKRIAEYEAEIERREKAGSNPGASEIQRDHRTPEMDKAKPKLTRLADEDIAFGDKTVVKTTKGAEVQVQYAVVENSDLVVSHDLYGNENPVYPQERQPRNRDRAASKAQIAEIAANIDPRELAANIKASDGAPIVDRDNMVVESGNGRTNAMRLAQQKHPARMEAYENWLRDHAADFGLDPKAFEGLDHPVLVRIRLTKLDPVAFAEDANEPAQAGMSPAEQALVDARKLNAELVAAFHANDKGEVDTAANAEFVRLFMKEIAGAGAGKLQKGNGALNADGIKRIRSAIFAKAYGDTSVLETMAESTDSNIKNVVTAMLRAAPRMVKVADAIAAGSLYPLNLAPEVSAAAAKLEHLRTTGQTVADYLRQIGLYGDDLSDAARDMLDVFSKYARSGEKLARILDMYNDGLVGLGDPNQGSMFGIVDPPTKSEALEAAVNEAQEQFDAERQAKLGKTALQKSFLENQSPASRKGAPGDQAPAADEDDTGAAFVKANRTVAVHAPAVAAVYRPPTRGRGDVVYANDDAMALMRGLLDSSFAAIHMPYLNAIELRDLLKGYADTLEGDGRTAVYDLREVISEALRTGPRSSVAIVPIPKGRTITEVKSAIRHELFHKTQYRLGEGTFSKQLDAEKFLAHPAARKPAHHLVFRGYPNKPGVLAMEIGAHLAGGPRHWAYMGIEDALHAEVLWDLYIDALVEKHGDNVLDVLKRTAPQLNEVLRDARKAAAERQSATDRRGAPGQSSALDRGAQAQDAGIAARNNPRDSLEPAAEEQVTPAKFDDLFGGEFDLERQREAEAAAEKKLEGERLAAEFNTPLNADNRRTKLKRAAPQPQTNLFEETPEAPQGTLFDRGFLAKKETPTPDDEQGNLFSLAGDTRGAVNPKAIVGGLAKFITADIRPNLAKAAQLVAGTHDDLLRLFAPAARGHAAKRTQGVIRMRAAEVARKIDQARAALDGASAALMKLPRDVRFEFIDRIETGTPQGDIHLEAIARTIRAILDAGRADVQGLGRGKLERYYENYFPHIWADPKKAASVFGEFFSKRKLEGPKHFLKKRTLPTFKDGLAQGLEPVSDDPIELVLAKYAEMEKFVMGHKALDDLKAMKLARFIDAREGKAPKGWKKIDDPIATVYGASIQNITEYPNEGLWKALHQVADALGVKHQRGFENLRGAIGRASRGGTVKTMHGTAEDVLAHEIGHQIDFRAGSGKRFVEFYPDEATVKRLRQARATIADKGASADAKKAARQTLKLLHSVIQKRKEFAKQLRDLADLRSGRKEYTHKREEKMAQLAEMWVGARELFKRTAPDVFREWSQFLKTTPSLKALYEIEGNTEVTATAQPYDVGGLVIKGHYWAPEKAAVLINNYLSPGLRNYASYRAYTAIGNVMLQFQLGWSAFHGTFVSFEAMTSRLALGVYQLAHGDIGKGLRSVGVGLTPVTPFTTYQAGKKITAAWDRPGTQAPAYEEMAAAVVEAGGRARMAQEHQTHMTRRMAQAFRDGNVLGAFIRLPFAATEQVARPIMEFLVPRMKLGVFAQLAQYEIERLGPNADPFKVREALQRAWDTTDDRMGQLVYDNLGWHRTIKDLLMGSIRTVGWNTGNVRQQGGGAVDLVKSIARKATMGDFDMTPRTSYLFSLPVIAAIYGTVIGFLLTGEWPETLRDRYYPDDGEGNRLALPTYIKETEHTFHDPIGTLKGKLHPLLTLIADMLTNRDYFNRPIGDMSEGPVEFAKSYAAHILSVIEPISVQGLEKNADEGIKQKLLPFIGLPRAPKWIDKGEAAGAGAEAEAARFLGR